MWIVSKSYQYAINLDNASRICVSDNSILLSNRDGGSLLIARYPSVVRAAQVFEDLCKRFFPEKYVGSIPFDSNEVDNDEVFYLPEE